MKSSGRIAVVMAVTLLTSAAVRAAHVDFKDPRRALGREDDIKVDAEIAQDTLSAGSPISVTYQIENLTLSPIAIADKVSDASFDPDSQTITVSIGAEIPQATMPHLAMIPPGQTRVFRTGAMAQVVVPNPRSPWAQVPRYVQITVNVLRDVSPFADLIAQQSRSAVPPPLPNDLFDKWVDSVSSVELNALPVRWIEKGPRTSAEVSRPLPAAVSERAGGGALFFLARIVQRDTLRARGRPEAMQLAGISRRRGDVDGFQGFRRESRLQHNARRSRSVVCAGRNSTRRVSSDRSRVGAAPRVRIRRVRIG
jgi:hypothetical protein